MGCLLLGMTCCWVRHDGDRLVGHLGSTRAAIVVEPDAVAADCFNTRRAILLKHSVRRLANAGQYVRTGMPGLAALLWCKLPGESDGICGGETTSWCAGRGPERYDPGLSLAVTR